ncbi:MAG: TFIIB-type zinc ribbon-containing protein [Candidatus Poseidoniaceae archaeon]|nr:TFIIB-type zinc ribbon-containing protein [Candidatus Poseidoniaceae archaeon]
MTNTEPKDAKKTQDINQRDNFQRPSIGNSRPSRRITAGQNRPCDECGQTDWTDDINRGEVICNSCGLVVEENVVDPGAEWTNYDSNNDRSRVGSPTTYTLADRGLNTSISASDLTSSGASRNGMNARGRRDWRRRRVIDERSKTRQSRARNLVKANQFIRDKSELPKPLQEETARLYRRLSHEGYVTGRSIAGVTAACTYLVAREENLPRRIPEIANNFQVDEKELSRLIRQISRKLNMHKITKPSEYFHKFVSDLELPPKTLSNLDFLWGAIKPHEEVWQGKKPMGVAATLIYMAAKEVGSPRTQAEICKIAGVSEVTMRGLIKLIDGLLNRLGIQRVN